MTPLELAKQNHHHDAFNTLLTYENKLILNNYSPVFAPLYTGNDTVTDELKFSPQELTLNTFLMGISLGYELAYQKISEGKLVSIKNELNQTHLFHAHLLYNASGLKSYVFIPYHPDPNQLAEVYVTFQGTNDTEALHRDVEHKGPGYQSYKQKETDLITQFFNLLSPLIHSHPGKISITTAGHSLGGGDCFYFLQSLLKTIAKNFPIPTCDPLQTEKLIEDKGINASDEITGIINETEKLLLQKPIISADPEILNINRVRVIALNPVGLPKSTDYALEGLARYIDHKLKIDSFILRSEGDFAQRMGDRVPLCDIPPHYATVNLLLTPGDSLAIQKASACYLGSASINPNDTQTSLLNIGSDMTIFGTIGGMALGPFGILLGMATGGTRLYASSLLKQWGRHIAWKPHTTLLPMPSEKTNITEILDKIKLLSNTNPESCALIKEVGHNLSATAFEKFMTETSKKQVTEKLKNIHL